MKFHSRFYKPCAVGILASATLVGCASPEEEEDALPEPTLTSTTASPITASASATTASASATTAKQESSTKSTEKASETTKKPREDESTLVASEATSPICEDGLLHQTSGLEQFSFYGGGCSKGYAVVAKSTTGPFAVAKWDGDQWEEVIGGGDWRGYGMGVPCWGEGVLEKKGAPPELVNDRNRCRRY